MASFAYNRGKYLLASGALADWDTGADDAYGVLLVLSGFAFNADHNVVADVSASESTDVAYTRKSLPAASRSWLEDDANDRAAVRFTGTVTWLGLVGPEDVVGAVVYRDGANDAARDLLCFSDFVDFTTNGAQIDLTWPNDLVRLT